MPQCLSGILESTRTCRYWIAAKSLIQYSSWRRVIICPIRGNRPWSLPQAKMQTINCQLNLRYRHSDRLDNHKFSKEKLLSKLPGDKQHWIPTSKELGHNSQQDRQRLCSRPRDHFSRQPSPLRKPYLIIIMEDPEWTTLHQADKLREGIWCRLSQYKLSNITRCWSRT